MPSLPTCFVYFLVDGKEVVYVGQTTKGIVRPLSHSDKEFTDIMIMEVSPENLDYLEEYYISKYSPKYNKILRTQYSMLNARELVRALTGNQKYNIRTLRKDAARLGISFSVLQSGRCYISPYDLDRIITDISSGGGL